MLSSRKGRIGALEQARGRHQKCRVAVFFLLLTQPITQAQQSALEEAARRAGRPTLIISGEMPDLPADYGLIVEADEVGSLGSPLPDLTPVPVQRGRWE